MLLEKALSLVQLSLAGSCEEARNAGFLDWPLWYKLVCIEKTHLYQLNKETGLYLQVKVKFHFQCRFVWALVTYWPISSFPLFLYCHHRQACISRWGRMSDYPKAGGEKGGEPGAPVAMQPVPSGTHTVILFIWCSPSPQVHTLS